MIWPATVDRKRVAPAAHDRPAGKRGRRNVTVGGGDRAHHRSVGGVLRQVEDWPAVTTGTTSFRSSRLIVTDCTALVFTPSETVSWSVKLLVVSRSSWLLSRTVIWPVPSIANTLLPPTIVQPEGGRRYVTVGGDYRADHGSVGRVLRQVE